MNDVNNLGSDLWAMRINYNDPQYGATALFNGNISETAWNSASTNTSGNPVSSRYGYGYDGLDRLTSAVDNTGNYGLSNISYDKMGNITNLVRNGHVNSVATSFGTMDDLAYTYDSGNKLLKVADNGNDTFGFRDGTNTNDDYEYDGNLNMVVDRNKGITGIVYNHLDMPTSITVNGNGYNGTIGFIYDANGEKLQKTKTEGGTTTTTDYLGDYVYENGNLKQITHPEGYIEPDGAGWQYVYRYVDIWENTRLTYADDNGNGSIDPATEIRREQNFYPGGLEHRGYNGMLSGVKNNLKTYQGQEFTEDLGLDFHEWRYRASYPDIVRFWQIDPLAEDYMYNSTFAFQENKFGMGRELEGLELYPINPTDMFNFEGGGKPVLTFGLHNIELPTIDRMEGGGPISFAENSLRSAWNGIASTWNAGMQGANMGDITSEGMGQMAETVDRIVEGEGTVQDAENLTGSAILAGVTMRATSVKGSTSNRTGVNTNTPHGNSKASTSIQHGYEITNVTKGSRHKVGVSGGALNKNGTSRRANSQVNALNKQGGDTYSASVKVKNIKGRGTILDWEQNKVNQHYKKTGTTAPGQKRPKPDDY